ncbi:MAG: glutamate-5-semialdehyde dehydrogenase [Defluviitaleaceae bacterium]|nr:glutamate-5-semialdehyde dehydrogenase [Defluviitaleaceae bacterium]MCL2262657.1 glutamate-5-semialdehyde dehydrogenase [Defluviitaleaceae bacterium]
MYDLEKIGTEAKKMAAYVRRLSAVEKNAALMTCADKLEENTAYILEENAKDMANADPSRGAFNDRLKLTAERVKAMAEGIRKVARQDDPTGETLYMKTLPNGLQVGEKRVPIGVVGMIYEARPNVTTDSFALCFKSGNACVLRGSKEAINSNIALIKILQDALAAQNHPRETVQLIEDTSRETARQFMRLNKHIDVLIPRGGAGLIQSTVENSTIPVIETGVGNCHIFVDESADLDKAVKIILNAKTQRPSVCNACEKLLIHSKIADKFLPQICDALHGAGVEIRGCDAVCKAFAHAKPATAEDWHTEFLDLIIGVKIVEDLHAAIAHISEYSSGHTEAILTENYTNANAFIDLVDSAAVFVNASTRFTDGEEFGLGAEVGISTQKLHTRGPMGLKALTTTKFFALGRGQVRE